MFQKKNMKKITAAANVAGEKVNEYIKKAIDKIIERDISDNG